MIMEIDLSDINAMSGEPHASDLFIDRELESDAFRRALAAHRNRLDDSTTTVGRHNILTFYGVGGIGKSALSERLEAWVCGQLRIVNGWGPKPQTPVNASVRIDLHESTGRFDAVDALAAIRTQLGKIQKRWATFDLAFATYWNSAHPGELLPYAGSDNGFAEAVYETIGGVASDLGALAAPVGVGLRSTRSIARAIRLRHDKSRALGAIPGYADLLGRCADIPNPSDPHEELAGPLATLLAHELSRFPGTTPLVVVFVDTFERLTAGPRRLGEIRFNQLAWSLPNVLFVVTGRNMVDWSEIQRVDLPKSGPQAWPLLQPGTTDEPRQHLIGNLSPSDRLKVIVLGRDHYNLTVPDTVVQELAEASGGLPQYLDLALAIAQSKKLNGGQQLTVDDVRGSVGSLVQAVLNDIPDDEQRAIRAAALFSSFDVDIVAATADVAHGTVERAMRRPMIGHRQGTEYPYQMHDSIREAILQADAHIEGGWSDADWKRAAQRGLRAVRTRYESAMVGQPGMPAIRALALAIEIACKVEASVDPPNNARPHYGDWIAEAIVYAPSVVGLAPLIPMRSATGYGQAILDFVQAKTPTEPIERRVALLSGIAASDHTMKTIAARHLAYTHRNDSNWSEAANIFRSLRDTEPTDLHRYGFTHTLTISRRFKDAQASAADLSAGRAEIVRLQLALCHGHLFEWIDSRRETVQTLRNQNRLREWLEEQGLLIRWQSQFRPELTVDEVRAFVDMADDVGHSIAVRDGLAALAYLQPGSAVEQSPLMERLESLDRQSNKGLIGQRAATVKLVCAWYRGDLDFMASLRDEIASTRSVRGRAWMPVEFLLESEGLALPPQSTQWMEPEPLVRGRWLSLFSQWRARVSESL